MLETDQGKPNSHNTGKSWQVYHLGIVLLLCFIAAAGVSNVFASEEDNDESAQWLGQDAAVFPELAEVPDSGDPARGESSSLDVRAPLDRSPEPSDTAEFQQVFDPDERERVTPTTDFPASAIAQIEMYRNGSRVGTCTGTFVGSNAVLTAAHCLYMENSGWVDAIAVVPGKDGSTEPFGYQMASDAWVPQGWLDTQNAFWDWGIVRLQDSSLGNDVGWFEIGVLQTDSLNAGNFNPVIAGYPGDKDPEGTQWMATEPSFTNVTSTHVYYEIDTYSGQSGAAVWRGNDSVVAGIHMGSVNGSNVGTRIDEDLLDDIKNACATLDCDLSYFVESDDPEPTSTATPEPTNTPTPTAQPTQTTEPEPTSTPQPDPTPTAAPDPADSDDPTPTPTPSEVPDPPGQPGNVEPFGSQYYEQTWRRTDGPIVDGHTSRTWMWGMAPFTEAISEPYLQSPAEERLVQYFDKSRMEITDPSADTDSVWFVTNGLLARELISGQRQFGDFRFRSFSPAEVPVAGDSNDPASPTYASFNEVLDKNPYSDDETISLMIDREGKVTDSSSLATYGITTDEFVPETDQYVAAPFWEFMNSTGTVYEDGSLANDNLFENPFYATGYPITGAYWTTVSIAGEPRNVLVQVFERRVLTYAPENPDDWQVEAGNVGIHYFLWRYVQEPDDGSP